MEITIKESNFIKRFLLRGGFIFIVSIPIFFETWLIKNNHFDILFFLFFIGIIYLVIKNLDYNRFYISKITINDDIVMIIYSDFFKRKTLISPIDDIKATIRINKSDSKYNKTGTIFSRLEIKNKITSDKSTRFKIKQNESLNWTKSNMIKVEGEFLRYELKKQIT